MAVGTFDQPNFETQFGTEYKTAIDNCFAALSRIGQMFAPHEQDTPDMTVRVDAGALLANVTLSEIAAQSTGVITAPAGSDHRIDRVVYDSLTGAVSVITGTPGALPRTAPAITTGKLPICQVALAHGMTVITNDLITDERVLGGGGGEAFPVGAIYINTTGIDPATELGYGTWSAISIGLTAVLKPPTAYSDTYVEANNVGAGYEAFLAMDPALPLTGSQTGNSWIAPVGTQRFHIALPDPIILTQLILNNFHHNGGDTNVGAKDFTLWGSNDAAAFADLTYANDTNWTQLTLSLSQWAIHVSADQADPQYSNVTGAAAYKYYALKIANNWGSGASVGFRKLALYGTYSSWERTA